MLGIGIDPGTTTGVAVWHIEAQRFISVTSMGIVEAMDVVRQHATETKMVVYEDARLRKWFGSSGRELLQGAGSIKRDCSIWAEFLGALGLPYKQVKPAPGATKWTQEQFKQFAGWTGQTNEHARDAALLVWGMQ